MTTTALPGDRGNDAEWRQVWRALGLDYDARPKPVLCPECGSPDCRPVALNYGCTDCGHRFQGPDFDLGASTQPDKL